MCHGRRSNNGPDTSLARHGLCLLISVVNYVMGIILKLSFPSTKIQKDYSYQPTVSVLMPCFNEGKTEIPYTLIFLGNHPGLRITEPELPNRFTHFGFCTASRS